MKEIINKNSLNQSIDLISEKNGFKGSYTKIFSLNYMIQGITQSMFLIIIPFYILISMGAINTSTISFMVAIILIPFSVKFIFGVASDKIGNSKRFGMRKLWIILPSILSGVVWMALPFFLWNNSLEMVLVFTISGFLIALGVAMVDCGMDGFILDICPPSQLGRVSGACWGSRALGIILGASGGLLLLTLIPIDVLFLGLGVLTIMFSLFTIFIKEKKRTIENWCLWVEAKRVFKDRENVKVFLFIFLIGTILGVIQVFISLYVLVRIGLVSPIGADIKTLNRDVSLLEIQSVITAFLSVGVLVGSFMGGRFVDRRSKATAIYISFFSLPISIFLLVLFPTNIIYVLLFLVGIVGFFMGFFVSAFLSVIGQYAKNYPKSCLSYYSLVLSFNNLGAILGLYIAGVIFREFSMYIADFLIIYALMFSILISLFLLGLIPFRLMDKSRFECKKKK